MSQLKNIGLFALLVSVFFAACTSEKPQQIAYNEAFDEYLAAFTHGEISKKSSIQVQLAEQVAAKANKSTYPSPFKFTPALQGETVWSNDRTIEFLPSQDLVSGQIYTAQLDMAKLLKGMPSDLAVFTFQFRAKDQFVNVSPTAATAIESDDKKWLKVQGELSTYDIEDADKVEKVLAAYNGDEKLKLKWVHDGNTHTFTIDSLERKLQDYGITWKWDGSSINSKNKGELTYHIPSSDKFKHTHTYRYNSPEQHIIVEFSDILDVNQDLGGLLTLDGQNVKYAIEDNLVKLYPKGKLLGDIQLKIAQNIKSLTGKNLNTPTTETITFSDTKPAVKLVGKGNIIPKSKKMPIVFQTVNLNAVDVRVIKIKEGNVKQFFQVNKIDGSRELKRVGTVVMQKKIALDKTAGLNLAEWTYHSLDLADLIEPEPGAIYEIAFGFSKPYSLFQCEAEDPNEIGRESTDMLEMPDHWDKPSYDNSYWDYYEEDYGYGDLEDPCSRYYYNSNKVVKRNILGSDLGIIAKQGDNGNLFAVNNLQTTEPIAGVTLEFYDYHQDLVATAKTDKEGLAKADIEKKPFFMIAKFGKQRGYLRLDDGNALSLSRFDVAGSTYTKGLKGFIYGERGVWRPGDEMFINFMLEDKDKALPANHPVTFELKDSRGTIVHRKTTKEGVAGVYNFTCFTTEDAPTGNYLATVKVGGAKFTKTIKVETIKPNRLKLDLDFGVKELSARAGDPIMGKLESKWLHGAIAKELKAKVEVTLKEGAKTAFVKYADHNFHDPACEFQSEDNVIFDGKLDEQGVANIPADFAAEGRSPGVLTANFRMQVFEPGGDFSISQFGLPYHPYDTYVGVRTPKGDEQRNMLLTDQKHKVSFVTVDKDGKTVSGKKLDIKLYKLGWKWWFDKDKDQVASYRGKVNASEEQKATATTNSNGEVSWEMEVKYPKWGRYLVRACDGEGHCSGQIFYIDWPGWAGRSAERDPAGATALNFSSDKEKYTVGDDITLNIPSGFAGRALVTVENGTKVLTAQWVDAKKGDLQHKIKATADMAPNAYVNITLLQPHAQTKNDLPIRMYGAIPIKVEDPTTHIEPILAMADELKPMKDFTVEVSERKGGPMTYTLAIVDEGLLDLTRFRTPSPWNEFYRREALGVRTWDMYDEVLGAFGGDIKSLLSIGGDGALDGKAKKKPDRFKPVVLYAGPFTLKKGEKKKHTFKMPNYVGSVRAMVVAREDAAYGSTEKAVPVRQPLMVLGTLPRVLGPSESIRLPVTVFTMKEDIKNVEVTVETNDLIDIVGSNKRSMTFKSIGDEMTFFELKTKARIGMGHVKITVKSGSETAEYETDIQLRNANPRETFVYAEPLEDGKTWKQLYKPVGMIGTNNGVLEVSAIPPINLGKRLKYLIRYPYGCVEQTTSSVFPQVYLSQLMSLPEAKKKEIEKNVKAGIDRLYKFQTADGGMAYWQGGNQANEWGTNYAGHFIIEAKKAGYTVRDSYLKDWLSYQNNKAQQWAANSDQSQDLAQAYRLYLLALHGKPNLGAMNRMRLKQVAKGAIAAHWHLAAAYHLAGQKDVAKQLAAKATLEVLAYVQGTGHMTFGSQFRDQALILQVLSLMDERTKANELVKVISTRLSSDDWLSTQETAQALVGMAKFVGQGGVKREFAFEYRTKGGNWETIQSDKPVWQLEIDGEQGVEVEFKNTSGAMLFARVVADGIPASENESETANGLTIDIDYKTQKGDKLDPTKMEQGTDFIAEVTVRNTGTIDYHELAIHQIFPSGWEIHNMRLTGGDIGGHKPDYQDIRDDRVYTFFDLKKGRSKTFRIMLNAAYLGKYYLPAVAVEAMYDKAVNARKRGQWIDIAQVDKK